MKARARNAGKIFVFYGGTSFGGKGHLEEGADVVLLGAQRGLGHGVALADLNADGYADMIAAAWSADLEREDAK